MIMADKIISYKSDSTYEISFKWPINPNTSDTIETGILTDSIRKLYPEIWSQNLLLGKPNYYSYTRYNDSAYFIPIEVPEVVIKSEILNYEKSGYSYRIARPKKSNEGYIEIFIYHDKFFPIKLSANNLDSAQQEQLIKVGLSIEYIENGY
jgi:hypothetical protein